MTHKLVSIETTPRNRLNSAVANIIVKNRSTVF